MAYRTSYYIPAKMYPIDDAYPEEGDVEFVSDVSGEDLDPNDIWKASDALCSREEAIELFMDEFVSKVSPENYQKAMSEMLKEGYKIEDFKNHPNLVLTDLWGEEHYDLEEDYDPIALGYMPNEDFYKVDPRDINLDEEECVDVDPRDEWEEEE